MTFETIVGNPPYQETMKGTSDNPIYHYFYDTAFRICSLVSLITPARFLFKAGKTPKDWDEKMLNDEHFKVVDYKQDSSKIFPNTDIRGGIAVTLRDAKRNFGKIGLFSNYTEIRGILDKVLTKDFLSFSNLIYAPESYRLSKKLHKEHPEVRSKLSKGHDFDITSNIFGKLQDIFVDKKPQDGKKYIQIFGLEGTKRVYKYVQEDYIMPHENILKWKVFLPKSGGSGAIGEVLSTPLIGQPLIGQPLIGHTQTFISIGSFDTEFEAEAVLKYIKTKFARTLLGSLKITQDNKKGTWENVPLQDFTEKSDINWSKSIPEIDAQLYKKYELSKDEIAFIEKMIRPMP